MEILRRLPELHETTVLVVEDVFIEAEDMCRAIESAGGRVLGPAASVEQALWLINRQTPDLCVLSVQLGQQTSTPVATRLIDLRIPFVVVTAFPKEALPTSLQQAPYLAKPFFREDLVGLLARSVRRP